MPDFYVFILKKQIFFKICIIFTLVMQDVQVFLF